MSFSKEIIRWYQENKRDLPWRGTRDPYVIWMSEVILQQTRVDQGLPYFYRFLERFPDVGSFAEATEDEILRLWQGLGYYSRARNMHYAARQVMHEYQGRFPSDYNSLIKLKGVGEYTAAAVASFAGGEPKAVVDGNVFRLLARYFGVDTPINSGRGKKEFQRIADELIDRLHPGLYNQAIMEFGSQQCKPQNPDCGLCVLQSDCQARVQGKVDTLPVKQRAKPSRNRYFNYLMVQEGNLLLMNKRGSGDIWENLYELPLLETDQPVLPHYQPHSLNSLQESGILKGTVDLLPEDSGYREFAAAIKKYFGPQASLTYLEGPVKHVLSHQNLYAVFWSVTDYTPEFEKKVSWNYVDIKQLNNLAKPKLIFSFLEGREE